MLAVNTKMKGTLTEEEAAGMTVNEMLFAAGLLGDFDEAVARRDELELRSMLEKIYLGSKDIEAIIKRVLSG